MTRFYQPDLSENIDSPFVRDGANKLVRRSYWLDMDDRTLVMVMVNGIGCDQIERSVRSQSAQIRSSASMHAISRHARGMTINLQSFVSSDVGNAR
jgi:hypothetical protein